MEQLHRSTAIDYDVRVPMPDGIELAADVYRPAAPGRYPVLLIRTPYDKLGLPTLGRLATPDILRTVRYTTAPENELVIDLERRPRLHPALPVLDAGTFASSQPGFDPAMARAEAGRCFRCDAVEGCATVHVTAGRGPADRPGAAPGPPPVRPRPIDQPTTTTGGVA